MNHPVLNHRRVFLNLFSYAWCHVTPDVIKVMSREIVRAGVVN